MKCKIANRTPDAPALAMIIDQVFDNFCTGSPPERQKKSANGIDGADGHKLIVGQHRLLNDKVDAFAKQVKESSRSLRKKESDSHMPSILCARRATPSPQSPGPSLGYSSFEFTKAQLQNSNLMLAGEATCNIDQHVHNARKQPARGLRL